jgi:hypothetical protein
LSLANAIALYAGANPPVPQAWTLTKHEQNLGGALYLDYRHEIIGEG